MKNVLFVGEHPFATTGNSGMLHSILSSVDTRKYSVSVFCHDSPFVDPIPLMFQPLPFSMHVLSHGVDVHGSLLHILEKSKIHALCMVGIDIWQFQSIMEQIAGLRDRRGFSWIWIFPYDLQDVREDWVKLMNYLDYPCVYSEYGRDRLEHHVPNIRYFRPPLQLADIWRPLKNRAEVRRRMYPTVADDQILFGFVGVNQIRKDPQVHIKGFSLAIKENPNIRMFMHTQFKSGIYHLGQYAKDCGLAENEVLRKPNDMARYKINDMPIMYNCFDCLVNCTMQEGLSWTPLEAMLCGVPVIVSNTTAHPELVGDAGVLVRCESPAGVPLMTANGESFVDAKKCEPEDIAEAMLLVAGDADLRARMRERGEEQGRRWLAGVSDINEVLTEACETPKVVTQLKKPEPRKIKAVLFAQHSAAGDVLMTTRCFKGLKERYDLPLHYMTMPQYMDILEGNPNIEKVIPWDEKMFGEYEVIINPHGERIAPGHWGRNCNSILSDFYWKILAVEPDDFFIELKDPGWDKAVFHSRVSFKPTCVVHTTGGDPHFRTYKYMGDVVEGIRDRYFTVQLGGKNDFPANADVDLRGKLSFRETAYVMSKASLAVTVDSFMSHLAGALGVSQVCLFGSGNYVVVQPKQVAGALICLSPDYVKDCIGLGPCSGVVKDCPAPCTGKHDPKDILRAIEAIESDPSHYNKLLAKA